MIVNRTIKLPFRGKVDVYRCGTCDSIVVHSQRSLMSHTGHRLKQPCKVTLFELLALTLGLIR